MKISHVFLQAFADPQGDGKIKALYFPNRRLPVRADLFNFVAWQLQTRAGVKVFAWMPVLSFDLDPSLPRVQRRDRQTGQLREATEPYIRLSPWDPQVRQQVTDIYEDLARYASFNGILFHDDAALTDVDDAGQNTTRQEKPDAYRVYPRPEPGGEAYPRPADKNRAQYVRLTHSAARKRSVVRAES